jgi:DNA excision repair protein ERCC-8
MGLPALLRRQEDRGAARAFEADLALQRCAPRLLLFSLAAPAPAPARAHRPAPRSLCALALAPGRALARRAGGVAWLDLDPVEHRYLLAAAGDGSVCAWDTQATPSAAAAGAPPLFAVGRGAPGGHAGAVAAAVWYPVDCGLFVSGGADCAVKVWDANRLAVAAEWTLPARVHALAMSPAAAAHALVAAGVAGDAALLCDAAGGGVALALPGHGAGCWAAAWSISKEWELATGSAGGRLRLWDVRRPAEALDFDAAATAARRQGAAAAGARGAPSPADAQHSGARAHEAGVTAVLPSPDGLAWLSAGGDDRLRRWDAATRAHALVHYAGAFNRARRARQLAATADGRALFHPSGSTVQVFDARSGAQLAALAGGHFDAVYACRWSPAAGELFTGGADGHVVCWAPAAPAGGEDSDRDAWSD